MRMGYSLNGLFNVGKVCALLSLLLVSGASLFNLHMAIELSDKIVEDSIVKIHHATSAQLSLVNAAMPPNDYIIHANPAEQNNYRKLFDTVNIKIDTLAAIPTLLPEQKAVLDDARHEWIRTREIGDAIMRIENPVGDPVAAGKMEQFDYLIDNIVKKLYVLHEAIDKEIEEKHERLHRIKFRTTTLIIVLSVIGLLIFIIGGMVFARALFPPLRLMQQGMHVFSHGDLEHRIDIKFPVEFLKLSQGFNAMAEKLHETYIELKTLITRDSLTGCFNHRKFVEDSRKEIIRARRYQNYLSLLIVDVDHFKSVNDTHGHPAGDKVLQRVTEVMSKQLRASDTLYRYGGEEFTIFLPETNKQGAHTVAERIRSRIEYTQIPISGDQFITVTVSIGIASFPDDAVNGKELLAKADQALYAAKNSGRNRVCCNGA